MTQSYPLYWPQGYERTVLSKDARFKVSLANGRDFLLDQIKKLGGTDVVISSNAKLRNDGLPYSKQPTIEDPGVAVYFMYNDAQVVFACDKWSTVADNIRALGLAIEAIRSLSRWGVSDMLNRAFVGFKALPAPNWWTVLGVAPFASWDEIRGAYRQLAKKAHPDNGGSLTDIQVLNEAYETAKKRCGIE